MQLFHCTIFDGDKAYIRDQEAKHLSVVLRKKAGDQINLTDGKGRKFLAQIDQVSKKEVGLSILKEEKTGDRALLNLAIAPTKNSNRFEWMIEKACEIGVKSITPLLCQRSERKTVNLEKFRKKLESASLQSLKYWFPILNPMTSFERFLEEESTKQKFIAYCGEEDLPLISKNLLKGKDVCILIGPEGDFSPEEFEKAKALGYQAGSFGKSRLRTETAGLMACAVVQQFNEE